MMIFHSKLSLPKGKSHTTISHLNIRCSRFNTHQKCYLTELDDGKIYRNPLYFMVKPLAIRSQKNPCNIPYDACPTTTTRSWAGAPAETILEVYWHTELVHVKKIYTWRGLWGLWWWWWWWWYGLFIHLCAMVKHIGFIGPWSSQTWWVFGKTSSNWLMTIPLYRQFILDLTLAHMTSSSCRIYPGPSSTAYSPLAIPKMPPK